jgi:hypothetical protein
MGIQTAKVIASILVEVVNAPAGGLLDVGGFLAILGAVIARLDWRRVAAGVWTFWTRVGVVKVFHG